MFVAKILPGYIFICILYMWEIDLKSAFFGKTLCSCFPSATHSCQPMSLCEHHWRQISSDIKVRRNGLLSTKAVELHLIRILVKMIVIFLGSSRGPMGPPPSPWQLLRKQSCHRSRSRGKGLCEELWHRLTTHSEKSASLNIKF